MNRLVILYGSETGTAQDAAEELSLEALQRLIPSVSVKCCSMDDYPIEDLVDESCVIFLCSTTGDGDNPCNMRKFFRQLLRKDLSDSNVLSGVGIAVFGLGDSSYEKFNWASKRLYRRLLQLGGQPIVERGDGDDQVADGGWRVAFKAWKQELWFRLNSRYSTQFTSLARQYPLLPPKYKLVPVSERVLCKGQSLAKITANERITAKDHFQDVRRLVLAVDSDGSLPKPGDLILLRGENSESSVDVILKAMGWNDQADTMFSIHSNRTDADPKLNGSCYSLREILKSQVDISNTPRISMLNWLVSFHESKVGNGKTENMYYERLKHFAQTEEGYEDWLDYAVRPKRSMASFFQDFDPVSNPDCSAFIPPSVDYVFDLFGPIRMRPFSISDAISSESSKVSVECTIGIVDYTLSNMRQRVGFFSRFLKEEAAVNRRLEFSFSPGTFDIISPGRDINDPMILICTGTGIAPLKYLTSCRNHAIAQTWLYFGCRNRKFDCHYQTYFESLAQQFPQQFKYIVAESRAEGKERCYVQDILKHETHLVELMIKNEKARIFVAGNTNLPTGVKDALKQAIVKWDPSVNENNVLSDWIKKKRLCFETW